MRFVLSVLAALVFSVSVSQAHEYTAGTLFIHHPAVNATPPGATSASGYFSIKNNGDDDDVLMSIEVPTMASKAEIHSMSMQDGVMQMRLLKSLPIMSEQTVDMAPDSIHVMFSGLKGALKEGDKFPGTLHFQRAGDVKVDFVVEPIGSTPSYGDDGHSHEGPVKTDPKADPMDMNPHQGH